MRATTFEPFRVGVGKDKMMKSSVTTQTTKFESLTVDQIMEKNVQCAHETSKTIVLASFMIEGFGAVPIVDEDQRLVGIVTEYDLLNAIGRGCNLNECTAFDIMNRNPASVTRETSVSLLRAVFQANHFIRVPVVDSNGKVIGIVARRDILRAYLGTKS